MEPHHAHATQGIFSRCVTIAGQNIACFYGPKNLELLALRTSSILAWVACYTEIVGSMQAGTDLSPVLAGHGYHTRCVALGKIMDFL